MNALTSLHIPAAANTTATQAAVRARLRPVSREPRVQMLVSPQPSPNLNLHFETAEEVMATPDTHWLVPGVLPAGGFAALFGPSGSGKSFLALDLSLSLALGQAWFGRPLQRARVTYLCLEGGAGFGKRVRAWRARHGYVELPDNLKFMRGSFQLQWRQHREQIASVMRQSGSCGGLVVIDTLSRAYGGADENSGSDMSGIVMACNELQRGTQAAVLLVHHTGKDITKGLRGHSSLRAALDSAIEVRSSRTGREWEVTKSKDGEEGELKTFRLASVDVGLGADGLPVTSCVVEPETVAQQPLSCADRGAGRNQRVVIEVLERLFAETIARGQGGAPPESPCVRHEEAVRATASELQCGVTTRRAERARTTIAWLIRSGRFNYQDAWLWQRPRHSVF